MDKMKLGIFCNFTWPSTGGSEEVCKAIAQEMYGIGMDVTAYGYNVPRSLEHNGVKYEKCIRGKSLLNQINSVDHAFIYSDSFWGFKTILENLDSVKPSLSIALLGMYAMIDDPHLFNIFKKNRKRFKVITHSDDYQDYIKCYNEKIPVTVIPNGVDDELDLVTTGKFKKDYDIDTPHMILNVSNYFYGKGQEYLADIGKRLLTLRGKSDFTFVQLSNSVKYPRDITFLNRAKKKFEGTGVKYKFLRDIPREDVISAFDESTVSVLTSLKEVSPLVILESMRLAIPWVSMDVGNVNNLRGGSVIFNPEHDDKGYKVFSSSMSESFAEMINKYLEYPEICRKHGEYGADMVDACYNWRGICKEYYNIFID
jgi:glycosyltransferase involved in cell wall biosynthesis